VHSSTVQDWKAARSYPDTYPGDCPDHAYVIVDQDVHPLVFAKAGDLSSVAVRIDGRQLPLDSLLSERSLPKVAERYPSLAYGANRNPGTLAIKMRNYGYQSGETGLVLPVLKGTTRGADVVACGLSGQGYLYADLLPAGEGRQETDIEAWLPLLDRDQVRVMHDGENVRSGLYEVAQFPFRLGEGFNREFPVFGYAGHKCAFLSPVLGEALAYRSIRVAKRVLPEMTSVQMMEHVLEIGGLRAAMAKLARVSEGPRLALDLMRFMNRRWWIRFGGEDQPDRRYAEVISALNAVIDANQAPHATSAVMAQRGLTLSVDRAYDPGPDMGLGALLSGRPRGWHGG